jgi:hypothetical protein
MRQQSRKRRNFMRTSITIATFLVVGAGVAGAAALPNPYFGSDTLFTITGAAIAASLGAADVADYVGGGSGGGASAMAAGATVAAAAQQTAPMSRMIKSEGAVCTVGGFNGQTVKGAADTSASGIVIGLDGVDLFASTSTGASPACQGPDDTQANDNKGFGLVISGTTGVFANGNSGQNWKWALALVYGGLDLSAPSVIAACDSPARQALVANWSNFFQQAQAPGTCSNTNAACAVSGPTGGALWHAFRRDDTSGTSDVFATLLGLSPSTSSSSNNGFGASPYCNSLNWDVTAGTTTCPAKTGLHDQWVGPGGVIDPNSTTTYTGSNNSPTDGTPGAAGTGNHRRPPPGTWGDAPDPTQNKFTSADVLPTQQQDNDPIRRPCLGGKTNNVSIAGEEVCNIDNALGLVLPMVDTDFFANLSTPLQQYPTTPATTFVSGRSVNVLNCAPNGSGKHSGECANGDALNLATCAIPEGSGTTQVVATKATAAPSLIATRSNCAGHYGANPAASLAVNALDTFVLGGTSGANSGCLANAGTPDGRHYNVEMRNGVTTGSSFAQQFIPALGTSLDFAAGYNRIHQVETVLGANASGVGLAAGCQLVDMTDQIACLSQADPCSIGYAGDAGKAIATSGGPSNPGTSATGAWSGQTGPLGTFDSMRAAQTYPSTATVQLLGQAGEYQIARKLYFNSLVGFANIADTTGDPSATDELTLAKFEATAGDINSILIANKEFTLGNEFAGSPSGVDPQFCEDFNEQVVCNDSATAPANVNGCVGNAAVSLPAGAAGAAGSNTGAAAGSQVAGTSTICGDGIRQAYEECDNGSLATPANGHPTGNSSSDVTSGGCSPTCRCNLDFNNTTGVCN